MMYIFFTDWKNKGKVRLYKGSGGCSTTEYGPKRLAIQMGSPTVVEAFERELLTLLKMDKKWFKYTARLAKYAELSVDKSNARLIAAMTEENWERALANLLELGDKISA